MLAWSWRKGGEEGRRKGWICLSMKQIPIFFPDFFFLEPIFSYPPAKIVLLSWVCCIHILQIGIVTSIAIHLFNFSQSSLLMIMAMTSTCRLKRVSMTSGDQNCHHLPLPTPPPPPPNLEHKSSEVSIVGCHLPPLYFMTARLHSILQKTVQKQLNLRKNTRGEGRGIMWEGREGDRGKVVIF